MSTSYYPLRAPVTSLRPEIAGGHTHVGVWVNHAKAGTLVVRNEEWRELLGALRDENVPEDMILRTIWGGSDIGTVVEDVPSLPGEQQVVSEYGELLKVEQVRAKAGAKRKNGMPTELFGYEEVVT